MEKPSTNYFDKIPCIVCSELIQGFGNNEEPDGDDHEPNRMGYVSSPKYSFWDEGSVGVIGSNYGSKIDGSNFYVGICDKCIDKKVTEGVIYYQGDDFGYFRQDETLKKWVTTTNRSINLNKLKDGE